MGQKCCHNCSSSLRFRDKCIFAFYAENKAGRQKCQENNFGENLPADSADALRAKNFVKIALAHSVFEINTFLHFIQKIHDGRQKIQGKRFWQKVASRLCIYPVGKKFCQNHSSSLCFRDKHIFVFSASRKIVLFS